MDVKNESAVAVNGSVHVFVKQFFSFLKEERIRKTFGSVRNATITKDLLHLDLRCVYSMKRPSWPH